MDRPSMRGGTRPKSKWMVTGILVLIALVYLFWLPRFSRPLPDTQTYFISSGGVSRAIIQDKSRRRGGRRRLSLPYLPHHLEYESQGGAIDVYVVRFPSGSAQDQVNEMTRLTNQLATGQPPADVVAQGSGNRGRISLHWWPYGWTKCLVLIRSQNESEVTLMTHFGP